MSITKSRRNIRSKRSLSRNTRSRKKRNRRRIKGGSYDKAVIENGNVLCKYQDLRIDFENNKITKEKFEEERDKFMLYQIKPNTLDKREYTNPMRLTEVMRYSSDVYFNYVDGSVECSGMVI